MKLVILGLLGLVPSAWALHSTNADTVFSAYNAAFYFSSGGSGYYKDDTTGGQTWFGGQAEEIEMALDNYDRTESAATRTMISALCTGFINRNGTDWTWNEYNDDISWAHRVLPRLSNHRQHHLPGTRAWPPAMPTNSFAKLVAGKGP